MTPRARHVSSSWEVHVIPHERLPSCPYDVIVYYLYDVPSESIGPILHTYYTLEKRARFDYADDNWSGSYEGEHLTLIFGKLREPSLLLQPGISYSPPVEIANAMGELPLYHRLPDWHPHAYEVNSAMARRERSAMQPLPPGQPRTLVEGVWWITMDDGVRFTDEPAPVWLRYVRTPDGMIAVCHSMAYDRPFKFQFRVDGELSRSHGGVSREARFVDVYYTRREPDRDEYQPLLPRTGVRGRRRVLWWSHAPVHAPVDIEPGQTTLPQAFNMHYGPPRRGKPIEGRRFQPLPGVAAMIANAIQAQK